MQQTWEKRPLSYRGNYEKFVILQCPGSGRIKRKMLWNAEIEVLRRTCLKARSKVQCIRRRKWDSQQDESKLNQIYHEYAAEFRITIKKAKTSTWEELMQTIENDLWGRPYKIVMGKIRKPVYSHPFTWNTGKHTERIIS